MTSLQLRGPPDAGPDRPQGGGLKVVPEVGGPVTEYQAGWPGQRHNSSRNSSVTGPATPETGPVIPGAARCGRPGRTAGSG